MFIMLLFIVAVDQDVIQVNSAEYIQEIMKDFINEKLKW